MKAADVGSTALAVEPTVELVELGKSYPGVSALSGVSLRLARGEVHSIVGENGAGKSTLVRILAGLEQADAGEVRIDGHPVRLRSPRAARRGGISYVPQEPEGIPIFSVGRNVLLGTEGSWVRRGKLSATERERVCDALHRMGIGDLDPSLSLGSLPIAQRRLCQIAATLVDPGNVILLDEPTAVLADVDAGVLLERLELLRDEGKSILYVSHRLSEVMSISDRISVLRDGQLVGTFARGEVNRTELLALMARSQTSARRPTATKRPQSKPGAPVLEVDGLTRDGHFDSITFTVDAGQVVGLAGIQGSGHAALVDALAATGGVSRGTIRVDGALVDADKPLSALRGGIRVVPEERRTRGIVPTRSIRENLAIGFGTQAQRRFFRSMSAERDRARDAVTTLDVRARDIEVPVATLSGGNQQKVVIGRVLGSAPRVLVLCEPTQGIDVRSKGEILSLVCQIARDQGLAVVIASSEFEELVDYADVVHVMRQGRLVATMDSGEATHARLLEAAIP